MAETQEARLGRMEGKIDGIIQAIKTSNLASASGRSEILGLIKAQNTEVVKNREALTDHTKNDHDDFTEVKGNISSMKTTIVIAGIIVGSIFSLGTAVVVAYVKAAQ